MHAGVVVEEPGCAAVAWEPRTAGSMTPPHVNRPGAREHTTAGAAATSLPHDA